MSKQPHFRFSEVEYLNARGINIRFYITKAPNESNLDLYIAELVRHNVKHVVRVCQPTYSKEPLEREHITVHDLYFADGKAPPNEVQQSWRKVIQRAFYSGEEGGAIAIHCVAGLGRAPVMVAIALIDEGMERVEVIKHIRDKVQGSFNHHQIDFLMSYKTPNKGKCIIA
eukprot:TRINITY_DN12573_c0_g1_i1.p1 TRINITY_DN12573_c0_g1~~TRINITY_DN12573_c0_g1_i1.p1  ORF type:complete len:170 (+),score=27.92 TRINITY_DN12573_c0_g1_i1:19-528(+)